MKEFPGHKSDAVDQYQVASDQQRQMISKVIEGESSKDSKENIDKSQGNSEQDIEVNECKATGSCVCEKIMPQCNVEEIGDIIDKIVKTKKDVKTVVRFEIEFSNE